MKGHRERRPSFRSGASGARGRWLVIGIIVVAVLLGFVGLRFRRFLPGAAPPAPATQPLTQPTTLSP